MKPDIVHAQGTERWCAMSGTLAPYPKVLTIHGNLCLINKVTPMEPRAYWKLQEMLETFSIPRFNGVVCITNYTQRNVADLAKKTWVVPNAVDLDFFKLGEEKEGGRIERRAASVAAKEAESRTSSGESLNPESRLQNPES